MGLDVLQGNISRKRAKKDNNTEMLISVCGTFCAKGEGRQQNRNASRYVDSVLTGRLVPPRRRPAVPATPSPDDSQIGPRALQPTECAHAVGTNRKTAARRHIS